MLSNEPKTFFPISRLYIPTVTVTDFNTAMEFCLAIGFGHLEDTKVECLIYHKMVFMSIEITRKVFAVCSCLLDEGIAKIYKKFESHNFLFIVHSSNWHKKVVKCGKYFLWYSITIETYRVKCSIIVRNNKKRKTTIIFQEKILEMLGTIDYKICQTKIMFIVILYLTRRIFLVKNLYLGSYSKIVEVVIIMAL